MSVAPSPFSASEVRFREIFDQSPISMQLLAADGHTLQVNKAWETLWQGTFGDGLKDYVLHGGYNLLTDPQLEAKGVTPFLRRACAGESVSIPPILYDPTELGIQARPRWVTGRAYPIRDEAGQVVEVMLMHEDISDRIESDESLRLSEERFRTLVTASTQMVWTSDPQGMVVEDSPGWRAFTGQTYDEWKNLGSMDAVHPDDRAHATQVWLDAVARKDVYFTECRVRRADGEYRWIAGRAVPILNADGSIREWIGTNTDITEQRRSEEAVRASEQRLRFILDAMQQKIFTATAAGEIDYINPAWPAYCGMAADEITRWGWVQFIHPDEVDENIRVWKEAIASGEPLVMESRFRRHDGQYRWHLSRAVPMRGDDGAILMWIGSNTDIHEVKAAESELARRLDTERRHSAVLSKVASASHQLHSAAPVGDTARELVEMVRDILEVHQAAITLDTGGHASQAVNAVSVSGKYAAHAGMPPAACAAAAQVRDANKALRLTREQLERQPDWQAPGGAPLRGWLAVPLTGHDGRNIGLLQASDKFAGEFTDEDQAILTQLASLAATGFENARLYGSLQEQHRRKDEFLAMLAHELRNPLAPIRAAADLLSLARLGEDKIRQTSGVISRQVQHMSSLVDDLLDVSRVTRGLIELAGARLDIKRVVSDAMEQVRPLVEVKRHQMTVSLSAEPAHVLGDHKRLVQVLANLLNNAVKYTPHGGRIDVRAETTADAVILSVEDNGVGVARELQPYVFELFAQAARSSDRSQGGLGIGLALVQNLVALHGGQVACHSEGNGRGSRFTVTLPRLKEEGRAVELPDSGGSTAASGSGVRVLVVDDNVDAAEMLALYLEAAGHEVMVEHNARDGLARAARELPCVCILDIGLPDMDGNALARALRQAPATAGALLVAVTGYGSEQDKESAAAAGFDHHLVKPVDSARLVVLLAGVRPR